MAYTTGGAADPDELLEHLKDFLFANGWTINRWDVIDHTYTTYSGISGLGKQLCVQKQNADSEDMFFNLRSCNRNFPFGNRYVTTSQLGGYYRGECTGLAITGSTGYDAGLAWDLQPGYTTKTAGASFGGCMSEVLSVCNYWFNQIGDTVNVIVEVASGVFTQLQFGTLLKQGSIPNSCMFFSAANSSYDTQYDAYYQYRRTFGISGSFSSSTRASGAVYVSGVDGHTRWHPLNCQYFGNSSSESALTEYARSMFEAPHQDVTSLQPNFLAFVVQSGTNSYSQVAPLFPIYQFLKRAGGDIWSLIGWPEGIRCLDGTQFDPKAEITLGTDVWKIFPSSKKVGISNTEGVPSVAILIS